MWAVFLWMMTAWAAPLQLQSADGVTLAADHQGSGAQGVVLVHGKGGSAADWGPLTAKLTASGFNVVAVDLRGHGKTGGALGPEAFPAMVADVRAAVDWLAANGASSVSVIGADLGANLALNAAAKSDAVANVLLLSPGLNYDGVKVGTAIAAYDGPILLVAGDGDAMSSKAAQLLAAKATGPKHLELASTSTRGKRLLDSVPDLQALLVSWLSGSFRNASDPSAARPALSTERADDIETTGTRLEDRR